MPPEITGPILPGGIRPPIIPTVILAPSGKNFIKTALTNRYLDVYSANTAAGTPLQIWDKVGGWNQVWQIIPSPEPDYVYIKSEMGRYLDVQWGNAAARTPTHIWDFNGGVAQKWRLTHAGNGYFTIQSKLGTFLDVRSAQTANGTQVWMWTGNSSPAQLWKFEPAGEGHLLSGFVDMHTHPMNHLGFGKKLLHGAPDIGSIIPAGTRGCNRTDFRASNINEALGNCNSTHGGWGLDNGCGNYVRAIAISKALDSDFVHNVDHNPFAGGNLHGDHAHAGIETSPSFLYWPHQTSKVHQQMWWEWLKRAYQEGGLRVMVALAGNSELLAKVIAGDDPKDDKNSADLQIDEIKSFIGRHNDFMEIAYTSTDLRRVVSANKLAVIIGIEVDNIGNFNKPGVVVNSATVKAEVQRLYNKGVRYIFPIHLVDNKFGGTAVYEDLFNLANKDSTGNLFTVQSSSDPLVTHRLGAGLDGAGNLGVKAALDAASGIPFPPSFHFPNCMSPIPGVGLLGCWDQFQRIAALLAPDPRYAAYAAIPGGHVNAKGLTALGTVAITEMMKLGMLIDIDHMSEKSINATLNLAERFTYPINIGHNGLRSEGGDERSASRRTIERVAALQGVFGVGTANTDPLAFISNFEAVRSDLEGISVFPAVAIGTDVNGMELLPRASAGLVSDDFYRGFPKCTTQSRTWDYTTEGVAHYGLMADFIKDVKERNVEVYNTLMKSAEYFAQMWEKCDRQKISVT